jgi:hypothetical protein
VLVTTVTVIALVAGCGGGTTATAPQDVLQVGEPPTRDWPNETPCPESLASDCAGRPLYLVATVNTGTDALVICATECTGPSDATIYGFGTEGYVLCGWPATAQRACTRMGEKGESVSGEAAIYAIVDD